MNEEYLAFLQGKRPRADALGFTVEPSSVNPAAFPFQRDAIVWATGRGRAALFLETGLGKTLCQLEWARLVHDHTGGDVLILAPLAVARQSQREAEKFNIAAPVTVCRSQDDVRPGINVTNYDRIHLFDTDRFVGVVLDESSILKAFMGKVKRDLVRRFASTPYRLACTATPAPNDHLEIGNQAEFLGIMRPSEMIMRWFINTFEAGDYRLKRHAAKEFWDWVASWALSMEKPSELGYDDDGFILPPLNIQQITVGVDWTEDRGNRLFREANLNATQMHKELRRTCAARADAVAQLVSESDVRPWLIWCHTNYEADAIKARIPSVVEVRGNEKMDIKEQKLLDFSAGTIPVMLTKPSIAGWGLNWQHCQQMAFTGQSYSFELYYQALRRSWRFGQTKPVNAYVIVAETEGRIVEAIQTKLDSHDEMMAGMRASSARLTLRRDLTLRDYFPTMDMVLPDWLQEGAA